MSWWGDIHSDISSKDTRSCCTYLKCSVYKGHILEVLWNAGLVHVYHMWVYQDDTVMLSYSVTWHNCSIHVAAIAVYSQLPCRSNISHCQYSSDAGIFMQIKCFPGNQNFLLRVMAGHHFPVFIVLCHQAWSYPQTVYVTSICYHVLGKPFWVFWYHIGQMGTWPCPIISTR